MPVLWFRRLIRSKDVILEMFEDTFVVALPKGE